MKPSIKLWLAVLLPCIGTAGAAVSGEVYIPSGQGPAEVTRNSLREHPSETHPGDWEKLRPEREQPERERPERERPSKD